MLPWLIAAVVLGTAAGLAARTVLTRWDYRYADERSRPPARTRGVVPVVVAAFLLLVPGHHDDPGTLLLLWVCVAVGAVLAWIDLDVHRLPDVIQLPAFPVLVAALLLLALLQHDLGAFARSLVGGLVGLVVYFLLAVLSSGQLGLGDVKLAALIGLVAGWFSLTTLALALTLGPIIGGFAALWLMVVRRRGRKHYIPYGPFLLLGALLAVAVA